MKKHTKVLFDYFGYDESSLILCELCGKVATDCHHIDSRWKFGSKNKEDMDRPNNLIFLCRKCHNDAHGPASRDVKQQLKDIVSKRVLKIERGGGQATAIA